MHGQLSVRSDRGQIADLPADPRDAVGQEDHRTGSACVCRAVWTESDAGYVKDGAQGTGIL